MAKSRLPIYPPVFFFASLLIMWLLHYRMPLAQIVREPLTHAGIAVAGSAFLFMVWAARLFSRSGTTIKPFKESSMLVTSGPYRITRNPMYLAMAVALFGAAVFLGSVSPFLVVAVFPVVIDRRFVRREEAMLEERFGEEFLRFKTNVRRWV